MKAGDVFFAEACVCVVVKKDPALSNWKKKEKKDRKKEKKKKRKKKEARMRIKNISVEWRLRGWVGLIWLKWQKELRGE